MTENYDIVVIGGGNGGLTAAAVAAKSGLKTLLLERNVLPGGSATSFRRGRFEFEASLHEMCNIGTKEDPGSVRRLFDSLSIDVDWVLDKTLFRAVAGGDDGYDVTIPAGIEEFCRAIDKEVDGSYESVRKVFEYAKMVNTAIAYLSSGKPDPKILMSEHADFLRMASHSVKDVLDSLSMPIRAQSILLTYWSYFGASSSELDFAYYAMALERYVSHYPAIPRMRSHEISLAIEKVIRDCGGEIRYGANVEKILVRDGKAYGVTVNGKDILCDHVIANCYPEAVYGKMIDKENIPTEALQLTNSRETGVLFFNVYLGLDRSCDELGIHDYSVFMYDSTDTEEQYNSIKDTEHSMCIGNCLNVLIPDASCYGTCIVSITTMFTEEAFGDIKPEDYKGFKQRVAKRLIEKYEQTLGVNIHDHIEEIVIAAPPTFARYLNSPSGTPYGYHIKDYDTIIMRTMNLRHESYIKNLSFTGAFAERGLGYSSTLANGSQVASRVVKEIQANGK